MINRDVALMSRAKSMFQNLRNYITDQNTKSKDSFDGSIIRSLGEKLYSLEYFQSSNESFDQVQKDNVDEILKRLPKECSGKNLVIDLPTLINGTPLNPNPANLVLFGKSIFYPEQFNTQIAESIERALQGSGKKVESMNTIFFHTGKGNVHCLTNGFRLCKP